MILRGKTAEELAKLDEEIDNSLASFEEWQRARPPRESVSRKKFAEAVRKIPDEKLELIARYIDRIAGTGLAAGKEIGAKNADC